MEEHAQQECNERKQQPLADQPYEQAARTVEHTAKELRFKPKRYTVHHKSHKKQQEAVAGPVKVYG